MVSRWRVSACARGDETVESMARRLREIRGYGPAPASGLSDKELLARELRDDPVSALLDTDYHLVPHNFFPLTA